MKQLIVNKLKTIENEYNIKIILAVESGSRAWGFASPDSDYDVRFIYVRHKDDYLKLERIRDVIELPINSELDINGWDLQKALRLMHKSNPTLFEWFSSPIVYMKTDIADNFKGIMLDYFSTKSALYHYISMAESNYREYLKGETVKAKKYFYVLRPILACRWILNRQTPPPMLFSELVKAELPEYLKNDIDKLLLLKINSPEIKTIPKIDVLNEYFELSISEIKAKIAQLPNEQACSWEKLNNLFMQAIAE